MKLSIGMACYDDADGVRFSIQSIRMNEAIAARDIEFLVVDNNPGSQQGELVKNFCGKVGANYFPFTEVVGTTVPRNKVFEHATGDAVLCMDSHVLFDPGAISKLFDFYRKNPKTKDLFCGPILMDELTSWDTHYNDVWSAEMWGTWGKAWMCKCHRNNKRVDKEHSPLIFSTYNRADGVLVYVEMKVGMREVDKCPRCNSALPVLRHYGHHNELINRGYRPLGDFDDPSFEVPGQGLGVFTCHKEAWLGFNPNFRGFGGEEMYIHEKYRQAGRRTINLPFLRWWHRFGHPGGRPPYPAIRWNKVRNYVLGAMEVGLPLEPIYDHFVNLDTRGQPLKLHLVVEHGMKPEDVNEKNEQELQAIHQSKKLSQKQWEYLIQDPLKHEKPLVDRKMEPGKGFGTSEDVDTVYESTVKVARDLNLHMPYLKQLAAECDVVEEITRRKESTIALLAAKPKELRIHVFSPEMYSPLYQELDVGGYRNIGETLVSIERSDKPKDWGIGDCDMLFYKCDHNYGRMEEDLDKWASRVRRWIVVHGTAGGNAEKWDNGEPGPAASLRSFLRKNSNWFVYAHSNDQWGLTVLGRQESDRPSKEIVPWPPGFGPGTELSKMLDQMGIRPDASCDCKAKANIMDMWGVEGCLEHKDEIVDWMRKGAPRWKWTDKVAAAARAAASGLAFKLNPLDPYPSLIDEAIRRAKNGTNGSDSTSG